MKTNNQDNEAIRLLASRRSIRGFLPNPVARQTVERILQAAARAPSGTNMQPWKVYVATGATLARLSSAVLDAFNDPDVKPEQPFKYYPDKFFEPYLARRRKIGWDLYGLLSIERGEHEKMHRQHGRNFTFFDAPVGMIFTIDARLEIGSWLDYGMFIQSIMIAARGYDLDTCPQAAFAGYHAAIRPVLNISDSEVVICGMALGRADMGRIENSLHSERATLDEFVSFFDD